LELLQINYKLFIGNFVNERLPQWLIAAFLEIVITSGVESLHFSTKQIFLISANFLEIT